MSCCTGEAPGPCPCCPTRNCCPNPPRTLHLTITGDDNVVVVLTWIPASCLWKGSFHSNCGVTIFVCFGCYSPYTDCTSYGIMFTCDKDANPCCLDDFQCVGSQFCSCDAFSWYIGVGSDPLDGCQMNPPVVLDCPGICYGFKWHFVITP